MISAPTAVTLLNDHTQVQAYAIRLSDANSVLRVVLALSSLALASIDLDWDRNVRAYRVSLALPSLLNPHAPALPDFSRWAVAAQALYLSFGAALSLYLQSL